MMVPFPHSYNSNHHQLYNQNIHLLKLHSHHHIILLVSIFHPNNLQMFIINPNNQHYKDHYKSNNLDSILKYLIIWYINIINSYYPNIILNHNNIHIQIINILNYNLYILFSLNKHYSMTMNIKGIHHYQY